MKNTNKIIIVLFLLITITFAQTGNLSGYIFNKETGKSLPGANIKVKNLEIYTVSDENGQFFLENIPADDQQIQITYIGYRDLFMNVNVEKGKTTNIEVLMIPLIIPLDEVEVFVTKSGKKMRDEALPVSLVREQEINQNISNDISEALKTEPGISISRDGAWGKYVTIRGLTRNNIVILIDGNRVSTATNLSAGLSLVDINDITRIETVKGGASSLYGTGATGGVINIVTKDGYYYDKFYVKAKLSNGFRSVNQENSGHLSLFTGSEKWYFKVSGMLRKAGDIKTPSGILENSQFQDNNFSLRLGIKPFQNHEIKLNYQRYYAEDVGLPGGEPLFPAIADVRYPEEKRDMFSIKYSVKNLFPVLPKISLKFFKQDILRDVENIPHIVKTIPGSPAKEMHIQKVTPGAMHKTLGFQFQSDLILNPKNHLVLGIDGWQKEMDSKRQKHIMINVLNGDGAVVNTINQIVGERPVPLATYRTAGVFFNNDYNLFENNFIVTFGGRYDFINTENDKAYNPEYIIIDGNRNDTPPGQKTLWEAKNDLDYSWSANLGLLYRPTNLLDLTLTLGKSFRSPTLEERYKYIDLGSLVEIGDPELDSEEGLFGDIGMKFKYNNFSLAANSFINKLTNLVSEESTTFDGRNALKQTNIGKAQLYGFDLKASCKLPFDIDLLGNLAYVFAEDTYNNQALAFVPPLNGNVTVKYLGFDLLNLSLAANFFADQDRVAEWEMETPGYTYFDVFAYTKLLVFFKTQTELYFGIENVTDKEFQNHLSTNRGLIKTEPGRNFTVRWLLNI